MLFRLFKNDLLNGKVMNSVLMLFIMISSMLSCTSIALLYSTTNSLDYFLNTKGNVAPLNLMVNSVKSQDKKRIEQWIHTEQLNEHSEYVDFLTIPIENLKVEGKAVPDNTGPYLTKISEKYNHVFDEFGNEVQINKGEVSLPYFMKKGAGFKIGDTLEVNIENKKFSYRVSSFNKDPFLGSMMTGMKRILFQKDDLDEMKKITPVNNIGVLLFIQDNGNRNAIEHSWEQAELPTYVSMDYDTIYMANIGVQGGNSALLLTTGIILLLMSFITMRFAILFQIENNYHEIGIMKAIGLQNKQIRNLYLMKYMGITIIGCILGYFLSLPLTSFMNDTLSSDILQMPTLFGKILALVVIVLIIILTSLFAIYVMRRMKKQSAIESIRKGSTGERFHKLSKISLHKRNHMSVLSYLGMSDIMNHMKTYVAMIIVYILALLLLILPLKLQNIFHGDGFLRVLNFTIGDLYSQQFNNSMNVEERKVIQDKLQKDLRVYDKNVKVNQEIMTSVSIILPDYNDAGFVTKRADKGEKIKFNDGSKPVQKDEIAITSKLSNLYNKHTGDIIKLKIDGKISEFMITGVYDSMMNLGKNMLLSDGYEVKTTTMLQYVITLSVPESQKEDMIQEIKQDYKDYKLLDSEDSANNYSGGMMDQMVTLVILIITLVSLIIFFITLLFAKLQILRDQGSIAVLESIGYHKKHIRAWQLRRTIMISIISIGFGLCIQAVVMSPFIKLIFQILGMGNITLQTDFMKEYIIAPLLLISIIVIGQWISNLQIKNMQLKDLSED